MKAHRLLIFTLGLALLAGIGHVGTSVFIGLVGVFAEKGVSKDIALFLENATPMLKQYQQIKAQHPESILLFRRGDFYEMFYDDARKACGILDVVLTSRDAGKAGKAPMCGIPFHAADTYIAKLIKAGLKVAICEQIEDPALAKGIVKREVIRVITSGTYIDDASPA